MNENIMVVDDDVEILNVLGQALEQESFNTNVFSEPMEALEEAKGSEYDIFLLDLKFPRTNGIALL